MVGRLGHFIKDVGGAAVNLGKTAAYVANPTHADEIAHGAVTAGKFVAENPGVIKDVGVAMLKEELKPQNLAINAALIAATVATGGAAAPAALAARGAMGARAARTGMVAAEGIEAGVEATKAARTASRTARMLKGAKEGMAAGRAAKAAETASAVEKGVEAGRAAETGIEAGKAVKEVSTWNKVVHPVQTYVSGPLRNQAAEKVLAHTGNETLAAVVQGTGAAAPARLAGQSEKAYQAQRATWRLNQAKSIPGRARLATEGVHAAADPTGYAMNKAMQSDRLNPRFGDTGTYETGPGGQAIVSSKDASGLNISNNGVVMPSSRSQMFVGAAGMVHPALGIAAQGAADFGRGVAASNTLGGENAVWKGANREALGGMPTNYDWRTFEQRPVQQLEKRRSEGFNLGSLTQPESGGSSEGEPMPSKTGVKLPPPVLPPQALPTASDMYKSPKAGITTPTTPLAGPRIMPKAGSTERGPQQGRGSNFYQSGQVSGEDADITMGGTLAWNAKGQGSFAFPDLVQPSTEQPKQATEVGTVKPMNPVNPVTPMGPVGPLRPMTQPLQNRGQKPRQLLGV